MIIIDKRYQNFTLQGQYRINPEHPITNRLLQINYLIVEEQAKYIGFTGNYCDVLYLSTTFWIEKF